MICVMLIHIYRISVSVSTPVLEVCIHRLDGIDIESLKNARCCINDPGDDITERVYVAVENAGNIENSTVGYLGVAPETKCTYSHHVENTIKFGDKLLFTINPELFIHLIFQLKVELFRADNTVAACTLSSSGDKFPSLLRFCEESSNHIMATMDVSFRYVI